MKTYYLAVDIGASSGRHILSHIENGKLVLEEIYRFENNLVADETGLVWDIDSLFAEVLCGNKNARKSVKFPRVLQSTLGALTMFCLMKTGKKSSLAIATVTAGQAL